MEEFDGDHTVERRSTTRTQQRAVGGVQELRRRSRGRSTSKEALRDLADDFNVRDSRKLYRGQLPVQHGKLIAQVGRNHKVLVVPCQLLRGTSADRLGVLVLQRFHGLPGKTSITTGHTSSFPACSG